MEVRGRGVLAAAAALALAPVGVHAGVAQTIDSALSVFHRPPLPDGPPAWEHSFGKLHVRFFPSMFYVQGTLLAAAFVYLVLAFAGRAINGWRTRAWARELGQALQSEFAVVGTGEERGGAPRLLWDGGDRAMLYASGRRGVQALHACVQLAPLHDPLQLLVFSAIDNLALPPVPWMQHDETTLIFRLPRSPRGACGSFALIDKTVLQRVRHGRFDLAFAKVSDVAGMNASRALDERFAIASEAANITDRFLGESGARGDAQRAALGLVDALNSNAGRWLVSLVWTDQPRVRPMDGALPEAARLPRLELTLRLPRTAAQAREALPLVGAALDIVDALHLTAAGRSDLLALRPETCATLRRTRDEVDQLLNEERDRDAKEEEEENRERARRQAAQERLEQLSPAEQEKRREIEKKRAKRKAQGRLKIGGGR
mgnify:CR=1 FL=1